jgi:hypothetical protein
MLLDNYPAKYNVTIYSSYPEENIYDDNNDDLNTTVFKV